MMTDFPSTNGLTWQEWRSNTYAMESTDNLANGASDGQFGAEEVDGTLSNEWADLEARSGGARLPYYEHQLRRQEQNNVRS